MTPNIDYCERIKVIGARIQAGQDTYAGAADAWHLLGKVFGKYTTYDELQAAAGADFEVVKKQLEWKGKLVKAWGTFRRDKEIPKGLAQEVIRVMNGGEEEEDEVSYLSFLGPVGEGYTVIPHAEGFRLLDSLVGQIDGAHYETMGTLDFGRTVWAQVNPNISLRVGDDESKIYVTVSTSHDGTSAFEAFETGVRMVCRNTYRLGSLKRLAATLRVKHTKNAQKRIDNLKTEIEEIRNVALSMQDRLTWLTRKRVTKESLKTVVDRLFPPKRDENEVEVSSTRRENILSDILTLYEANDGGAFPEQAGTPYALFNAVTNYTDHLRSTKGGMRAESAVFGSGDKLKRDALSIIMEEAERMPDMLARNYERVAAGPNVRELGLVK